LSPTLAAWLGCDLDDEYTAGSPHAGDTRGMMNSGELLRQRYDETLLGWLERKLKKLGVE
jgi:hypothetical protein